VISTLLRAEAMTAGYGKMPILHEVSLIIAPGELVAVIGPNGAGKSTTFKVIVGFLKPTQGRVLFDGDDITGLRPDQVLRRGLAYVPQGRIVFPQMTVLENLEMGGYTERNPVRIREALERVYALFPILAERRHQKAGTMSGGEQQMVAIARGLMARPTLLMIDEPFLGLAPRIVEQIAEVIRALNRERGLTVVFIEQNVELALGMAHRGYVLESGRNVIEGPSASLLGSPEVKRIFLGA